MNNKYDKTNALSKYIPAFLHQQDDFSLQIKNHEITALSQRAVLHMQTCYFRV